MSRPLADANPSKIRDIYVKIIACTGRAKVAANLTGISRDTWERRMKADADFKARVQDAREHCRKHGPLYTI